MEQSAEKKKLSISSLNQFESHIHPSLKGVLAILVGNLLLFSIIILSSMFPGMSPYLSALRFPLAMLYIFFVPGYLIQALIFPGRGDLDNPERAGISLGISLAMVSILAFMIDRSPWEIGIDSISIGQMGLILILSGMVMIRKLPGSKNMAHGISLDLSVSTTGPPSQFRWRWIGILVAGLLIGTVIIGANFLEYSSSKHMTEFFILGSEGLAENFPREVEVGENIYLTVGINNLEVDTAVYSIVIEANNQQILKHEQIYLPEGKGWQEQIQFVMNHPGEDQAVNILLDRENYPFPYRGLRIWLNVRSE